MRMRLNLARALVNRPCVLFLDEPTSGIDPVHVNLVRDLVRDQAGEDRTVFLTTHDMATAEQLCDRIAFMVDGRLVAVDTPRNFRLAHAGRVSWSSTGTARGAARRVPAGRHRRGSGVRRGAARPPGGDHPHAGGEPRRRVRRCHRWAAVNRLRAAVTLEWTAE
jgi:ABC-type multidrug transport system ATPase subunit